MSEARVLAWVSGGAASIVAAKLALSIYGSDRVELIRCETSNEDQDNLRFEQDASRWLGKPVTLLRSDRYESVWDVWEKRRFMAGPSGAACTLEMKVVPRLTYQLPDDIHVFGYTADSADQRRFEALRRTYFELRIRAPLIEAGLTKAATLKMLENAGIELPRTYALGFSHANCLLTGCVKASSPSYWSLFRLHFPDRFARMATLSRDIGKRLVSIRGRRIFLDELPADWPTRDPIAPVCDFLCSHAEREMRKPRMSEPGLLRRPLFPPSPEGAQQLKKLVNLNGLFLDPSASFEDELSVTIKIARRRNPKMRCPDCLGAARPNGTRRVFYRHVPVHGKPTRLEWDRQRFLCTDQECGRSFSDSHPSLHPSRQMSLRLIDWICEMAKVKPLSRIAKECGLSEGAVASVYKSRGA